jgi:hypothetical protein
MLIINQSKAREASKMEDDSMLHDPLRVTVSKRGPVEEEDDNPLARRSITPNQTLTSPSSRLGKGPRRKETYETLVDIAKLGRLQGIVGSFKTRKSAMRARLSALREDLLKDDDEVAARRKIRDVKSRHWVLELLARDVQLWWEKNDRTRSLRAACLLAGALSEALDSLDYSKEWVLVIDALNKLVELLKKHLEDMSDADEQASTRNNWYYKVAGIRGLVARLYLEAATCSVLEFDIERLYLQGSGISNSVIRQYFTAFLLFQAQRSARSMLDRSALARDALTSNKHEGTAMEMLLPLALTLSQCVIEPASFPKLVGYTKTPIALQALMKVSDPETVCEHVEAVLEVVDSFSVGGPTLVSIVADKMLLCVTNMEEKRIKSSMNRAWLVLQKYDASNEDMTLTCSAKFLELCCARLSIREISVLVKDLERRLREGQGGSKNLHPVIRACSAICGKVKASRTGILSSSTLKRLRVCLRAFHRSARAHLLSPRHRQSWPNVWLSCFSRKTRASTLGLPQSGARP